MRPMCQVKQKLVLTRLWKIEGEKELTESDHPSRKGIVTCSILIDGKHDEMFQKTRRNSYSHMVRDAERGENERGIRS
jgi:hypothetical protein